MGTKETSQLRLPLAISRKSAAYVLKNYRYLQKDPGFFLMKTVARFEVAREWVTREPPFRRREPVGTTSAIVQSQHDAAEVVSTLRNEGYYVGLQLAPEVLAELVAHSEETTCYGDRDPALALRIGEREEFERRLGRPLKLASYFKQQEEWPIFRQLREDPLLQAVSRAYLGCEPVYLRSELAWSFPYRATAADKRAAAQVLHCDINDYKTLKFFFYLTDVGPENGPHAYIKKNPRQRTALHQLLGQRCASLSEAQLLQTYGTKQLVTVCGAAGLGFAGDPYYFHRGTTPLKGARLLLQLELGCRRYRTWYFDV